ncbi:uncharacterized protein LOC134178481 [Corticium candelabrum]|uniref:uncharacterized protein LOC134178481 n=1 Tax=Corticium candelabrum TaxID=121492 RepID=UPI002E26289D|nr:uncharacterized protein LOC134178481 [Corticium candelabrum]
MSAVQLSQVYTRISSNQINDVSKKYNRFLWDVVFRYFTLLGITLVAIGLGEEFFLERGLACNTPEQVNRDQYRFVVLWCSRHVRQIDLLPLLILAQALLIVAPQVLWDVYSASYFQQFFSLTPRLERLRSKETGDYDVDTTRTVKHLRQKYKGKLHLWTFYHFKLIFQIIVTWLWIAVMLGVYRGQSTFDIDFVCSEVPSQVYNLNMSSTNVQCTYTTAEAFYPLWIADITLLVIAAVFGIYGFVWLKRRHWKELDHQGNADFCYKFCMTRHQYNPDNSHKSTQTMKDDLDFLTLVQFNSDRGQGESLYDVQVDLDLQTKWADDYEKYYNRLQLLKSKNATNQSETNDDEHQQEANDLMKFCLEKVTKGKLYECSLHLFCGSKGCTLALANISKQTYAVDFNPFQCLKSKRKPVASDVTESGESAGINVIEQNFQNICHLRVPVDITSMTGEETAELSKRLQKVPGTPGDTRGLCYDLVFVNCLETHFRASTARVVLDLLQRSFRDNCIILVCSPNEDLPSEIMEDIKTICVDPPPEIRRKTFDKCKIKVCLQQYEVAGGQHRNNEGDQTNKNTTDLNMLHNRFSTEESERETRF